MINTNKKIHIYNRLRTIYTSKNRYYIRHNKKYIDLYAIIKKASLKDLKGKRQQRGGGSKDKEGFLSEELNAIKNGIVIFKLLIDDKQSETINIYINLIELINSKKELIINKINTYPQNYFDNELNKSAIITYVKNMLYKNIFHNYLLNIIPRIDINNFIKTTDKDAIENIIKSLLHLNNNSDEGVLEDTMIKIEKYNDIIKSTIKSNCTNYEDLKVFIREKIEDASKVVKIANDEKNKEEDEADEAEGAKGVKGAEGAKEDEADEDEGADEAECEEDDKDKTQEEKKEGADEEKR